MCGITMCCERVATKWLGVLIDLIAVSSVEGRH